MKVLEAFGEPIADGGQEAFVFGVLEKMDISGLEIDCLTAYDCRSKHYKTIVEKNGGRIHCLHLPFVPGKSRNNIARPFRAFLKKHSYDIIHIHSGSISVLAIMASVADKAGVKKVIVHSHATGSRDSLKHRLLRYLASLSMRNHVDVYCACSQQAADWKFEPRYACKARIIRNGIDSERFRFDPVKRQEMRDRLSFTKENTVIGHVGRFTKEKNQIFLLKILKAALKDNTDTRLLLVGAGDEFDQIKKTAVRDNLIKQIVFAGSVQNVEDYLQAMDVFIFPSLYEGLGIAAIEAQCAGLPVVASDTIPEDISITDAVTFLSLKESPEKWAEAVKVYCYDQFCDCRSLRKEHSTDIMNAGYDMVQIARQVQALYKQEVAE